jgi:hypothetical protein
VRVRLLVDHSIATDAERFAAQWNSDNLALKIGVASVEDRAPVLHAPILDGVTIVLVNVGLGITANLLTDVLKPLIERMQRHRRSPTSAETSKPSPAEELDIEVTESIHLDGTWEFKLRLGHKR